MLLGGVQIPGTIITAWEEGRLVIFTGAGVSMANPSSLPNFLGLAKEVAARLQSPLNPEDPQWVTQLDTFMDVLDQAEGADVHVQVKRIVTKIGSEPNDNHDALARIATRYATRVVTTNYDRHLETRLRDRHSERLVDTGNAAEPVEVFRAPALPLGHDFDGLVYLHGSAQDDASRLVVTDRDFSGAYFQSAWATRFLESMFREYVVMFVGYSHSDVVMKYLGLGLGPDARRFVITDKPDDPIWDRLLVTPVEYPEGRHDVLTQCLTAWADLGDMGLLDHRQRIRDVVSTAAEPTPEELSYIEDAIRREDRVKFFCEFATDNVWLKWAATQDPFRKVFDRSTGPSKVTNQLASWYADTFAVEDDAEVGLEDRPSALAWSIFAEAGGTLSTDAWNWIGQRIHASDANRPEHVVRWLWILMQQEHVGCNTDFIDYAIEWVDICEDQDLALALLAHLMDAHLAPASDWGTVRMEVKTRGDMHYLDEAWEKQYFPQLETLAPVVFPVVEAALLKHLNLEAKVGSRRGFLGRRSAIQLHAQDKYRDPIDVVIDAVRDSAVALWSTDESSVWRLIERWLLSGHLMLHRIAVHVAGNCPSATPDDLVKFVLDHGLETADGVGQEVLHLLGNATSTADSELVDQLVSKWEPESDEDRDLHRAFVRLEWLERNEVANENLATALAALRSKLPEGLEGSPYPGMSSWMESGSGEGTPPLAIEEFDKQIKENPAHAVEFVLSFEERSFPRPGESDREDAISMLGETVRNRPAAGLELWPCLSEHPDLQGAVIAAWGHATEQDDAEAIMDILVATDLQPALHSVGQFLIHAGRRDAAPWERVPTTDLFIEHLWDAASTEEVFELGTTEDWNWMSKTINVLAGLLMGFWFETFRRRWAAALEVDAWRGIGGRDREFLERALNDRTERGSLALTQMASRLHFLDSADSSWCREHLLPLRNWADPLAAEPFWWGVLSTARWNSGLVADGLLDGLLETVDHLDVFADDQQQRWASILASIAVRCESPPAETWVDKMTGKTPVAHRVDWLKGISKELEALDDAGRGTVWAAWLAAYCKRRTEGDPVTLADEEAHSLALLGPHVSAADFPEAVRLILTTTAGLGSHGDVSRQVSEELIDAYPVEVGRFLTHLMRHTDTPFWGEWSLLPKLKRVVAKPGNWETLREAALTLVACRC